MKGKKPAKQKQLQLCSSTAISATIRIPHLCSCETEPWILYALQKPPVFARHHSTACTERCFRTTPCTTHHESISRQHTTTSPEICVRKRRRKKKNGRASHIELVVVSHVVVAPVVQLVWHHVVGERRRRGRATRSRAIYDDFFTGVKKQANILRRGISCSGKGNIAAVVLVLSARQSEWVALPSCRDFYTRTIVNSAAFLLHAEHQV